MFKDHIYQGVLMKASGVAMLDFLSKVGARSEVWKFSHYRSSPPDSYSNKVFDSLRLNLIYMLYMYKGA